MRNSIVAKILIESVGRTSVENKMLLRRVIYYSKRRVIK